MMMKLEASNGNLRNSDLTDLGTIISTIDKTGHYYYFGMSKDPITPSISVREMSVPLSHPVSSHQVLRFTAISSKSGDEKNGFFWEIESNKIEIDQEDWNQWLDNVLVKSSKGLGLGDEKIVSELLKLVVCDKTPTTLTTLKLNLPQINKVFGYLIVSLPVDKCPEDTSTIPLSSGFDFGPSFVAFYANSTVQIKSPDGLALLLVYKLKRTGKRRSSDHSGTWIRDHSGIIGDIAASIKVTLRKPKLKGRIIYILSYPCDCMPATTTNYEPTTLDQLDANNQKIALALKDAVSMLTNTKIGFGQVTITQSGSRLDNIGGMEELKDTYCVFSYLKSLIDDSDMGHPEFTFGQILPLDAFNQVDIAQEDIKQSKWTRSFCFVALYIGLDNDLVFPEFKEIKKQKTQDEEEEELEDEDGEDDDSDGNSSISEEEKEFEQGVDEFYNEDGNSSGSSDTENEDDQEDTQDEEEEEEEEEEDDEE
ncbi:hypothetical protein DFA_00444 [Cavenderia fasciculata]|uniref:Uncharacterized protein n=1 Tax=Cavenderia fasciculata TaxID=261658 RepID=F4PRT4_CACFS|nr:uncharacterized protein DFA_00444 [Cavenderia fasciculata]EGG20583.1 hypothetical protein DFA_00444 [Cavenderia fasciculata]|eukprot:XP_004358433.1 hypothetical protein DFA_00444 [Cavenderia fasciculata]